MAAAATGVSLEEFRRIELFRDLSPEVLQAIAPNLGTLKALFPLVAVAELAISLHMLRRIAARYEIPPGLYRAHQLVLALTTVVLLIVV